MCNLASLNWNCKTKTLTIKMIKILIVNHTIILFVNNSWLFSFCEPNRALLISVYPPSFSPLAISGNYLTVIIEFSWRIFYISLTKTLKICCSKESILVIFPQQDLSPAHGHSQFSIHNFFMLSLSSAIGRVDDRYYFAIASHELGGEIKSFS